METVTKYQPLEVLDFIKSIYKQQQQVDSIALKGHELTFKTTIEEWRDICDLLEAEGLAKCYNETFQLNISPDIWRDVLEPADNRTLRDFCHFIAQHAEKQLILPITLLGHQCSSAATFRMLMANLQRRGINTTAFRPSTKLQPLLQKYSGQITEEVSLMNPHALPPLTYKENSFSRIGLNLVGLSLLATNILAIASSKGVYWTAGFMLMSFMLVRIGAKLPPKQIEFVGIDTLKDLIKQIETAHNMNCVDFQINFQVSELL